MTRNVVFIPVPVDTPEQIAEARALLTRFGVPATRIHQTTEQGTRVLRAYIRAADPDPEPAPETLRSL